MTTRHPESERGDVRSADARQRPCALAALRLRLPAACAPSGRRPDSRRSPQAGRLPALAREGVDVGPPSSMSKLVSAEQIEKAATEQYSQLLAQAAQKKALAPESHPQVVRLRSIAQPHHSAHLRMESAGPRVALGGQPDRQPRDQRVLHAGRQDRLLRRHPRAAEADRRRGRDGDGPRDGACAARARARADGQDHGDARRDRDRRRDLRPRQRRPPRRRHGRPTADLALRSRGRIGGRSRRPRARGPRRLQPAGRRDACGRRWPVPARAARRNS